MAATRDVATNLAFILSDRYMASALYNNYFIKN